MTAQGSAQTRRAIERKSVLNAELAAREMGQLALEDALSLVLLYASTNDPRSTAHLLDGSVAEVAPGVPLALAG